MAPIFQTTANVASMRTMENKNVSAITCQPHRTTNVMRQQHAVSAAIASLTCKLACHTW